MPQVVSASEIFTNGVNILNDVDNNLLTDCIWKGFHLTTNCGAALEPIFWKSSTGAANKTKQQNYPLCVRSNRRNRAALEEESILPLRAKEMTQLHFSCKVPR